jgi:hypothetical protein
MNGRRWYLLVSAGLVLASLPFFFLQYEALELSRGEGTKWLLSGLFGGLAFLPLQVLLVTLVIDRLLARREKAAMLKKMNMVIGVFFSEVGTELLSRFRAFDAEGDALAAAFSGRRDWGEEEFVALRAAAVGHGYRIDARRGGLREMKDFLRTRRELLLSLLENPNLLEHEGFTDLLWAVFHLSEELSRRDSLDALPPSDLEHLSGDLRRACALLVGEWVSYLSHLREDYPYLFSLAVRTNPFDPEASVVVR